MLARVRAEGWSTAQQLITGWQAAPRPTASSPPVVQVRTGQPFALLRIPALGRNWKFAVVEGASLAELSTGPGHLTGTQLPGQAGNFAVAAHDITAGNPFLHLKSPRVGLSPAPACNGPSRPIPQTATPADAPGVPRRHARHVSIPRGTSRLSERGW